MRLKAAVGCLVLGLSACGTGATQSEQERQTQNNTLKAGDAGTQPGKGSGNGNGGPNGGGVDCFALKEALAQCIAQNWGKSCDAIVADLQKCQPTAPPACDGPWPVDPNGGTKPGDPNGGGEPNGPNQPQPPPPANGGGTKPNDPNGPVPDPAGGANGGGTKPTDPNGPVTDPANGGGNTKPTDPNTKPTDPNGSPNYPVDPGCVPPPLDPCIALKNLYAQCIQTLPSNPICSQILAAGLQQCGGSTSPNGPNQPPVPDGPKK